jgi:DUF1707 SHOCT-like domain
MAPSGRPYYANHPLSLVARCRCWAGNEMAASESGRGDLRASHADREQVIATLQTAFVQGRLSKDELDARVGQTLAARTYADLAALTADLPAGLTEAWPPRRLVRAQPRPPMSNAAKAGICVAIAVAVPTVLSFAIGGIAIAMFVPWYFVALLAAAAQMLRSRYDKKRRRRGQLPPPPMQSGQVLEGEQNAKSGDDWVLCQTHRAARARHLPGHDIFQRIVWALAVRADRRGPADLQIVA